MTEQLTLLTGSSYRNFIQAVHSPFSRQIYKDVLKHFNIDTRSHTDFTI